LLSLHVLVLAVVFPLVVPAAQAQQPQRPKPARGPAYVEKVTRLMQRDQQLPKYPPQSGRIPCQNGFAGPYPCKEFDLLSHVTLAQMGGTSGNDVWGWRDPVTGEEWAIMGLNTGTSFVNVTDPENPEVIGRLPTHSFNSLWRDVEVFNNHVFVVSEATNHGMQVMNLARLRTAPPGTIFPEDAHYPGFSRSHTLAINTETGFAYANGSNTCAGGLHMININNPLSPQFAGCFSSDGYTHDSQCVIYQGPDVEHRGQEICFNSNEDTLTIVNVTNKNAPVQLSRTTYPGVAYTHQTWLKPDHTQLALDDELDEQRFRHNTRTRFFDVTNLEAPFVAFIFNSRTPAIDHNQYWLRDHVFQSNYRAGLRLLELRTGGLARVLERGYFDIHPPDDLPAFNGTWSNYPYLPSRNYLISSIEEGLFVVVFSGLIPPP
jgi:choice-of-anchor B domain-containing protein